MISWWILFILIKCSFISCNDYICNYLVNKSDNTIDLCLSNTCNQFVDPYSIMVRPNNCKTKYFSLSFSTYKKYNLFLNRIEWKLSDLFPLKLNNQIRQLRIYIKQIHFDDQPIEQNQLIRLGNHIDLYQLYLQNINQNNSLYRLIHYHLNEPEWDIIQIQFNCHSLIRFGENSCSIQIIPPPFLAPRRPTLITQIIPLLTTVQYSSSSSSSLSTEQSQEQNSQSIHLIILILIPALILLITIFTSIFVYRNIIRKRSINRPRSSSIPSISHNLDSRNGLYSECRPSAKPYQVSRLPSPHKDSLYKEPQQRF